MLEPKSQEQKQFDEEAAKQTSDIVARLRKKGMSIDYNTWALLLRPKDEVLGQRLSSWLVLSRKGPSQRREVVAIVGFHKAQSGKLNIELVRLSPDGYRAINLDRRIVEKDRLGAFDCGMWGGPFPTGAAASQIGKILRKNTMFGVGNLRYRLGLYRHAK